MTLFEATIRITSPMTLPIWFSATFYFSSSSKLWYPVGIVDVNFQIVLQFVMFILEEK